MSDLKNQNILISGASIAGPALAYWLTRYGARVTIIERSPAMRKGGYAVDVRGAAIDVLERMGIMDEIRAADTAMEGILMVNPDGNGVFQVNDASLGNQRGVDIEVMRDDISQILFDLTAESVETLWGDSITALNETPAGVEVTFEHAAPRSFDLVVGADGLHSNVRRLAFGSEAEFNKYLGCYISIFTTDNFLNLDHRHMSYNLPGKMASVYSARDNQEAKVILAFKSPQLEYDHNDTEAHKRILTEAFGNVPGWEVPRLVAAMQESTDLYFDSLSQIRMTRWSKGRVVLLGDAGYCPSPASGQGTSLAVVGAYVLAGELNATGGNYETAFAAYETRMREFVQKNQRIGEISAGGMVEDSRFGIWMRDTFMRIPALMGLMYKFITSQMAQVANAVEIKEYGQKVT